MKELEEVVGWYDLGLYLNVPSHVLETIQLEHQKIEDRKIALFDWWPKWEHEYGPGLTK